MNNEVINIRISKLLELYPYLQSRAYNNADTNALDTIIDLDIAIAKAELDDVEYEVMRLIYMEDLTQFQVVERMGINRDIVRYRIKKVLTRVGRAYYYPERYKLKGAIK